MMAGSQGQGSELAVDRLHQQNAPSASLPRRAAGDSTIIENNNRKNVAATQNSAICFATNERRGQHRSPSCSAALQSQGARVWRLVGDGGWLETAVPRELGRLRAEQITSMSSSSSSSSARMKAFPQALADGGSADGRVNEQLRVEAGGSVVTSGHERPHKPEQQQQQQQQQQQRVPRPQGIC
ncbi:unnamed protein product [Lampetra planeri]